MDTDLCGLLHLGCYQRLGFKRNDAWKRQEANVKKKKAYSLVYLDGSGDLQNMYRKDGAEKLREHVKDKLGQYIEEDINVPGIERRQQRWKDVHRGSVGENPVHVCFLSGCHLPGSIDKSNQEIGKIILDVFPDLSSDTYTKQPYLGESALHFAIVQNDMDLIQFLVEHGTSLSVRAKGTFFVPPKPMTTEKIFSQKYVYYGEYPLSFAASLGLEKVYDYFIDHQVDGNYKDTLVDRQDTHGNTALHMCVLYHQKSMYLHAIQHPKLKADQNIKNEMGLTPIAFACWLGHSDMFEFDLDLNSTTFWTYRHVSYVAYRLDNLDSIDSDGKTSDGSALSRIVNGSADVRLEKLDNADVVTRIGKGSTDVHLDLLKNDVVDKLLHEKWYRYIQRMFIFRFVWTVLHLILLSVAVYLRPANHDNLLGPTDGKSIVRYITEIGLLISCTGHLYTEARQLKLHGRGCWLLLEQYRHIIHVPSKMIFSMACLLLYVCLAGRLARRYKLEDMSLMIAVPCSWTYLLFSVGNDDKNKFYSIA
ncbi:transient receptor potential cation channel subfamily V member 1-like [Amphiura filiformis]|uniref:transient receptor potential cation channel subfamily V member 1-like n=1 Tax=Amphiura filiformis TaxID=82378 RepID=UPI003B21F9D6